MNQLAAYMRQLERKFNAIESQMSAMQLQGGDMVSLPGQYTGKPMPTTEGCEIAIPTNTNLQQNNIVLTADGPFIAHRIVVAFRHTGAQGNFTNQWRPVSSVDGRETTAAGVLDITEALDFYWEYVVTGSRRERQNIRIPSACMDQRGVGIWDLCVPDAMEKSSTITFKVTPTVAPTYAGVIYVGFHGYYILD
jgi:hypothetical protein